MIIYGMCKIKESVVKKGKKENLENEKKTRCIG
jgi:hypothetical protein